MIKKTANLLVAMLLISLMLVSCGAPAQPPEQPPAQQPSEPAPAAPPTQGMQDTEQKEDVVDQTKTYKDTVIIGSPYEIEAPNSYLGSGPAMNQQAELLYSRLCEIDKLSRELIADAAIEWGDVSPEKDSTIWEFKLRRDMTFHNGKPLTAVDIQYSWDVAHDPTIAPNTMSATTVFDVEIVDDYTVKFHLGAPDVDFPRNARLMFIVNKETCEEKGFDEGGVIGTGPYMFEERQIGIQYSYVKFEGHYNAENYMTRRLVMKIIPDASTRLVALQTGEIDVMSDVNAEAFTTISEDDNLQIITRKGTNTYLLNFCFREDVGNKDLQDIRVRQAISHALNRDEIVQIAFVNMGEPWNCVASSSIIGAVEVKGYEYNPEKAKELLAEAGFANGLTFRCVHWGGVFAELAAIMQAQLMEVGITLDIEQIDIATFNTTVLKGDVPLFFSYNGSTVTDIFSSIFAKNYLTDSAFNCYWTATPEYEELVAKAQASTSLEERLQLAAELCQVFDDNAIAYPIAVGYISFGARKEVEGLIVDVSVPTMSYATIRIPE